MSNPNAVNAMLTSMIALQKGMNEKVDPDWKANGWNWKRAIWLEAAEAVEHLPWKWWKNTVVDSAQLKMEVVDLWHFVISLSVQSETEERLVASVHKFMAFTEAGIEVNPTAQHQIEAFESLAASAVNFFDEDDVYERFFLVMAAMEMGLTELYQLYVGKNVLNLFRQDHGYKAGTYVKDWDGLEDNQVLTQIMEGIDIELCEDYPAAVYLALKNAYRAVINKEPLNATV